VTRANDVLAGLRLDARIAANEWWVNRVAGSALVPGALRRRLYRLAGYDVRTSAVRDHVVVVDPGCRLVLGRGTFVNRGVVFEGLGPIVVGDDCFFGPEAMVITSHHPRDERGRVAKRSIYQPVVVEDGAWIGARAVLLPGVTIGAGTVVAAGAVVTRDQGPGLVVAGVPARPVGERAA
jgi:maltose O-acetyltransferase